jgi:hypothetical protein
MGKAATKARRSARPDQARRATKKHPDEEPFTRSLVKHGQAVEVPDGGRLPPGATHELVEDENGELRPVRRRFSTI